MQSLELIDTETETLESHGVASIADRVSVAIDLRQDWPKALGKRLVIRYSVPVTWIPAALAGFGLGLSLIVAIGAQNAYVLRQGLRGEHVAAVVAVCVVSDALLIAAGVAGIGAVLDRADGLVDVIRVVGALFLFGYAVVAARRAWRPTTLEAGTARGRVEPARRRLHLPRPDVAQPARLPRHRPAPRLGVAGLRGAGWAFAVGAAVASLVWFVALGYGARYLRPLFARPVAWRVLDAIIAVVMIGLAIGLAVSALS